MDLGKGVRLEMVWIAPGEFTMGSPKTETNRNNDEEQHRVKLTKGFWLGKYEVTQQQYLAFTGKNPSRYENAGLDAPVEMVPWTSAMEFCQNLTASEKKKGRLPGGYVYSLPTEAQWEYACRAGDQGSPYSKMGDMAWYNQQSGIATFKVGQKKANPWGLYDMQGNVQEWCLDWYAEYPTAALAIDPIGPKAGTDRVNRGGSWKGGGRDCRPATRNHIIPTSGYNTLGFRLALVPVQ